MNKKYSKYLLTYHAFQRAKERISEYIIHDIKTISLFMLEIRINEFIRNCDISDIEYFDNNSMFFLIPNTDNLYIFTKKNIIITIKPATVSNFNNILS